MAHFDTTYQYVPCRGKGQCLTMLGGACLTSCLSIWCRQTAHSKHCCVQLTCVVSKRLIFKLSVCRKQRSCRPTGSTSLPQHQLLLPKRLFTAAVLRKRGKESDNAVALRRILVQDALLRNV